MTKVQVVFLKDGAQYGYNAIAGSTAEVYENDMDYLVQVGAIEAPTYPAPEVPAKKVWNFKLKQWEYETSNAIG